MDPQIILLLIVVALGLCFGSFITLASWRLPRDEDIIVTPSRCPKCLTKLESIDLVPVISWLCSGRQCRHCNAPIHWRYPLVEIITALIFVWIYGKYGVTVQSGLLALLAVVLMVMIVADFEHYMIPDEVHWVMIPLAAIYIYAIGLPWPPHVFGLLAGLGTGLSLRYGYRAIRGREGLGMGDVKFLVGCGLWLGIKPLIPFLFFAGIFGVLTGVIWRALGNGHVFPFGPALAASLFMCVSCPEIPEMFYNISMIF